MVARRIACVLGLLAVQWAAAPSLPADPPKPGAPSAEHLEKLRDKLRELNPEGGLLPVRDIPLRLAFCFSHARSSLACGVALG
jgi:hypothetical protein